MQCEIGFESRDNRADSLTQLQPNQTSVIAMRLSFGQELRLVQKQVLAPRMIQSMEILQLPIMALQERIEQEMQENQALELLEQDPDLPDEETETQNPDAPTPEERELVVDETKDNEADFERLLNMDEEWPDHFEERTRPSATRVEEEGDRQHDAMANMVARPQSLQDYLHDQLGWFDLDAPLRQMCDRIIYNLDSNGYLQGRLEDLVDSAARPGAVGAGPAGPGHGATARSARRRGPRPARMPAVAAHARHAAITSNSKR